MNLNVCVYNVENLFIKNAFKNPPNINYFKSELRLNLLKKVFLDTDADIYALTEIGRRESLEYFNEHYLEDKYDIFHMKGNSDRGIENAYLIRKGIELDIEQYTHIDRKISFKVDDRDTNTYKLSRDASHIRLLKNGTVVASLFNLHLKSQRDDSGHDFRSVRRRKAELELVIKLYIEEKSKYPDSPIILCGDFNGNASSIETDEEFKIIYEQTDLKDILMIKDTPIEHRATFFQFQGQTIHPLQLDYAFMDKGHLKKVIDHGVYRYTNSVGSPIRTPQRKADIWNNPSDHYPIFFTIEL